MPEAELSWRFSRSSGPGGQGVNTTDSRAELSFDVHRSPALPEHLRARALRALAPRLVDGVLTVAASEHRSQLQNREAAEQRLAQLLREAVARRRRRAGPPGRRGARRSGGSRGRGSAREIKRGRLRRGRRGGPDEG